MLSKEKTRLVVLGDPHGDLEALKGIIEYESNDHTVIVSVGDNVGYADGPTSSEFCRLLETHKIPSVFGNHEEWLILNGGRLVVCTKGSPRVAPEALRWISALPFRLKLEFECDPVFQVTIIHSIERLKIPSKPWSPGKNDLAWDYVSGGNVLAFSEQEAADIVFCGHSHGPMIYTLPPNQPGSCQRLDLVEPEYTETAIESSCRYVVDAGSLGRPSYFPARGNFKLGSYATFDLKTKTLRLATFQKV